MDNYLGDIVKKFRKRKGLKPYELSKLLKVSSSSIEYLEDGKTKNPGISIFRKLVPVLELNPYDIYELITGNVYTEKPSGSIAAENDSLKKKQSELEEKINILELELSNSKQRESFFIRQIESKDRQIESKDRQIESKDRQLHEQSELHKATMEHAGKAQTYLEQIADSVAYKPKTPSSDISHTEGGQMEGQTIGSEKGKPIRPVPE